MPTEDINKNSGIMSILIDKCVRMWNYVSVGVWTDTRKKRGVNLLRVLNLSVNSFLNRDIQSQACALTYRTMLAFVPVLAVLIAIGRGFGFQAFLQQELYRVFPAQQKAIEVGVGFVESYLNQASSGVFIGVGIVFLLWTLISLVSNVESSFNLIWGQKKGRSIWRKISDYTALLLILPILMICAGGFNLLLSTTLRELFNLPETTPIISIVLESASWVMTWLFFTAAYLLIPNTKVGFKNALISGIIAGTGFKILQWLFVTGTLYVAKYNAIYGSFAFLPLLLIWLQLVWVITLAGAVICYSSQNVFAFSFSHEVANISETYFQKTCLAVATIFTHRFVNSETPLTSKEFMEKYELPAKLVSIVTEKLIDAGIISQVVLEEEPDAYGFQLSVDPNILTVGMLMRRIGNAGAKEFIPHFSEHFQNVNATFESVLKGLDDASSTIYLSDIKI